jgi:hypothetical protein
MSSKAHSLSQVADLISHHFDQIEKRCSSALKSTDGVSVLGFRSGGFAARR